MSDPTFYKVFARKYRPRKFSELVAQSPISTTLRNALKAGKVYHAYLFTGPRGVGKTTSARILAKALNCPQAEDSDPCGQCPTCLQIAEGRHSDVLEIDGASNNGIAQVRELRESAAYVPKESKHKIYIIDEVHMLSTAAFNGLLKILEEPPPHVAFVMATTEPQKIPATVQSRCQRFDFKRLTPEEIAERIEFIAKQEGIEIDAEAVYQLGRLAEGSMRDAQSLFDQLVAFCGEKISGVEAAGVLGVVPDELFLQCSRFVGEQSPAAVFPFVEQLNSDGHDPTLFLRGYLEHLRTLVAVAFGATPPELVRMPEALRREHEEVAKLRPVGDLVRAMRLVGEAERALRNAAQPRIELELILVRLAMLATTVDLQQVLAGLAPGPGGAAPTRGRAPEPSAPGVRRPFDPGSPAPAASDPAAAPRACGPELLAELPDALAERFLATAPLVGTALGQAQFDELSAGHLRLSLPANCRSVLPRLRKPEIFTPLVAAIGKLVGFAVQLELSENGDKEQKPARIPSHTPRRLETIDLDKIAEDEPLVREVLSHFKIG